MNLLFLLAYSSNWTFTRYDPHIYSFIYNVDYYCEDDCKGLNYYNGVLYIFQLPSASHNKCLNDDSVIGVGIDKCGLPEQTPEITLTMTPDLTPQITPELTPMITPNTTYLIIIPPEQTPELTPEITVEQTPEQTPEITPQITPKQTPMNTPEQTLEITSKEVEYVIVESKEQDDNNLLIYIIIALFAFIILILFIVIIYCCCCKRRTQEYSSSTSTIEIDKLPPQPPEILPTITINSFNEYEDTDPFENDFIVSDEYFDQMEK